jgi:hypothetical protein
MNNLKKTLSIFKQRKDESQGDFLKRIKSILGFPSEDDKQSKDKEIQISDSTESRFISGLYLG